MMGGRWLSYLNTAAFIIETYNGSTPLVHHLKHYFAQFKKHGSKDRKYISHACYCYFRLGKSIENITIVDQLKIGLFLCNNDPKQWENVFDENWITEWSKPIQQKNVFVQQYYPELNIEKIFPWQNALSTSLDGTQFSLSHLTQPYLFIRLRPGYEKTIVQRLRDVDIPYQKIGTTSLALENSTKLEDVLQLNEEVVVQDLSSQQITELITPELIELNWQQSWKVWDCCTASGGKTILLHDIHRNNEYYLTDVRAIMQHQLKQRLDAAHIHKWKFDTADLTETTLPFARSNGFDFIIADVPCTGSGTWARTPEQIQFFKEETITEYASTQKKIISNILPALKNNGYLLYITCSVFKQENEEVVEFIEQKLGLQKIKLQLIKGYSNRADTMFATLFKKL